MPELPQIGPISVLVVTVIAVLVLFGNRVGCVASHEQNLLRGADCGRSIGLCRLAGLDKPPLGQAGTICSAGRNT